MNKQIQELALNAARAAGVNLMIQDPKFVEKFAELLVRACADAADMAVEADIDCAGTYVVEQMGFGQEEGATMWRFKA